MLFVARVCFTGSCLVSFVIYKSVSYFLLNTTAIHCLGLINLALYNVFCCQVCNGKPAIWVSTRLQISKLEIITRSQVINRDIYFATLWSMLWVRKLIKLCAKKLMGLPSVVIKKRLSFCSRHCERKLVWSCRIYWYIEISIHTLSLF